MSAKKETAEEIDLSVERFRGGLFPANAPVRIEARNPKPGFKRLSKAGDIYTLNIEIQESAWNLLKTMPETAMLDLILHWNDGDIVPPPAKKEQKSGEWGGYWHTMFKRGIQNDLELRASLEVSGMRGPNAVREALHVIFDVDTLREVSPDQFEEWAHEHQLEHLVTLSRLVVADLQVREGEK